MRDLILFPFALFRSDTGAFKRILAFFAWILMSPFICFCGFALLSGGTQDGTKAKKPTVDPVTAQSIAWLTESPTFTSSPTDTPTPTATYTPTNTEPPTVTPSPSETFTPSDTPTSSATPTASDTPTATLTPSDTFTPTPTVPTNTPAPTATLLPDELAAQVIRDLHGTDIHDGDFIDSTCSLWFDCAIVVIYLSEFDNSNSAAAEQAKHDYPILACALREVGFTDLIDITGSSDEDDRVEAIEIGLEAPAIASLNCDDPASNDVFAIADSVVIAPDIARYFDLANRATPVVQTTLTPANAELYIIAETANIHKCPSVDCEIVGTFSYGELFYADSMVTGWYRFKSLSGYVWVSSAATSMNEPPRAATQIPSPVVEEINRIVYITSPTVNIRECASTRCQIVGTVGYGASIRVTGLYEEEWYRLVYNDTDGWISVSLTSDSRPPTLTPRPTAAPRPTSRPATDRPQSTIPPSTGSDCPCNQGNTLNCSDFSSQSSAQACYNKCIAETGRDVHGLDSGGVAGVACENN